MVNSLVICGWLVASILLPGEIKYEMVEDFLVPKYLPKDTWCDVSDWGPQYYFPNVEIFSIDTVKNLHFPQSEKESPIRVAIDNQNDKYILFGLGKNEYNLMVEHEGPCAIEICEAQTYGEFYLDITRFYDPFEYFYVGSADEFLKLNYEIMKDGGTYVPKGRDWWDVKEKLLELCKKLPNDRIQYDSTLNQYLADYYVWPRSTGEFIHIRLAITPTGKCTTLMDEVLATNVGYWWTLRR